MDVKIRIKTTLTLEMAQYYYIPRYCPVNELYPCMKSQLRGGGDGGGGGGGGSRPEVVRHKYEMAPPPFSMRNACEMHYVKGESFVSDTRPRVATYEERTR